MKQMVQLPDAHAGSHEQAASLSSIALFLLPFSVLVSACGGAGGDGGGSTQVTPLLQVGQQRTYTGTTTRAVVYANQTATQQNNTLVYNFTENQAVQQAPTGAPANFDVQISYAYTVVTDPGTGVVPLSQTVDDYENLTTTGSTQQVTTLGEKDVTVSNDETANALGNGPYTQTLSVSETFPTPRPNFSYPLQTGATMTSPQSADETTTFTDVNASGAPPTNGSNVGYTLTRTENDDGSFSYQQANVTGTNFSRTQNSDGSGSQTYTNPTSTTDWTLGVPVANNGVNTIPITETVTATHVTTTNYSAQDWYPNGGAVSSPLILSTRNVVGPASSLPTECANAVAKPGIYEVDTTTDSLVPWGPTYTTTATRNFSAADGASVCQLTTTTESTYALDTGALVSTTTTTTSLYLSAINY